MTRAAKVGIWWFILAGSIIHSFSRVGDHVYTVYIVYISQVNYLLILKGRWPCLYGLYWPSLLILEGRWPCLLCLQIALIGLAHVLLSVGSGYYIGYCIALKWVYIGYCIVLQWVHNPTARIRNSSPSAVAFWEFFDFQVNFKFFRQIWFLKKLLLPSQCFVIKYWCNSSIVGFC